MSSQLHAQVKAPPMPASFTPVRNRFLQRCEGSCGCREEDEREERRIAGSILQRRPAGLAEPSTVPPIVDEVLRSPGQPLDPATRAFMEPRFGHDFSRVRVHTDARAAESARAVNALAYTVGRDVVFGAGQYAQPTRAGRRLVAHELTHVVQQGGTPDLPRRTLRVGPPHDVCEREAHRMADRPATEGVGLARHVTPVRPSVQRVCNPPAPPGAIVSKKEKDYQDAVTGGKYCKDTGWTGLLHPGKRCYRQVPVRKSYRECPPGDQVCFDPDSGKCEDSYDDVSPVESSNADGSCNLHALCSLPHASADIVPWLYASPGRGAAAGAATGLLAGALAAGAGIGAVIGWLRSP